MVRTFPYHVNHHVAQSVYRQGSESSLADVDGFFQFPMQLAVEKRVILAVRRAKAQRSLVGPFLALFRFVWKVCHIEDSTPQFLMGCASQFL